MDPQTLPPAPLTVQLLDRVLYRATDGSILYALVLAQERRFGFKPAFQGVVLDGHRSGHTVFAYHYQVVAIEARP